MRRIFGPRFCLLCLACSLIFLGSCGQGEGGRCQIDSDCAGGLTCSGGDLGNGICRSNIPSSTDDAALSSSPDTELDAGLDAGLDDGGAPSLDGATVDVFTADDGGAGSD